MRTYQRQLLRASRSQSRSARGADTVPLSSLGHAPAPCEFKNLIQKDPTHRGDSQNLILNAHRFSAMTSQRYRGGRQSKGDRQALISRVATPLGEAVREKAEARGMSVNDYIASVLAREVGMAELAPQSPVVPRYQELPISEVA